MSEESAEIIRNTDPMLTQTLAKVLKCFRICSFS